MTPEAHADSPINRPVPLTFGTDHVHDSVTIDCDRCSLRGIGCGDCVVTVLLGGPPYGVPLDDDERRAIDVLADAGLVPPLRMVDARESKHSDQES